MPPKIVAELDDALSTPPPGVVDTMNRLDGDLIVLGVGGKMGPTLARMARRASDMAGVRRRVIGVSRFSSPALPDDLRRNGIEPITCDLLDEDALERLPDAPNVVFMAGLKFGSSSRQALTWAMNCYLPGAVSRKYRHSRIVAFSTGNVYGLSPVSRGGSVESDEPRPVGCYAHTCLGREMVFEHFSRALGIPMAMIRLNYAVELRYGVLVDIARQVWAQKPVSVRMGHFNAIWQAEANAMALEAFDHAASPPLLLNVTGQELLSVRQVAGEFGRLMGKPVHLEGEESRDALISNARRACELIGTPTVSSGQMIEWIAEWVMKGGELLDKPTHFEVRDGNY
ncbi:NAD(P)-dependent oxidoreductase [bacterium]|nr:NAD(P)-dependent oxidoreductase [bacterium]